ncbi:MAG: dTDP-glucose 4,6-dehydratase [Nitrospirae bacterium]|nr:dTDP-glucose 4,6-dehydratase [Nitrospirota bacterium]
MKLLVTGGAGFIGSNFIRYMIREHPDYQIINLDKLTYAGNPDNLRDIESHPNYRFVQGDICDPAAVEPLAKAADLILNFAAETHVDRSILEPGGFIQTDVFGTYVLLEAAKRNNHERYIQISTDEVYGSIDRGAFTEASPLHPNSPYAASKAAGDLLVQSYVRTYGFPAIITRSSNNFGPYQYPEKVIPLFITNALEDKPLPLYGDGQNIRDWIYVIDNCAAIDLVLHRGRPGEVYNIGGGSERTNIGLTRFILNELGKPVGLIQYVKDRSGHDRRYALDCGKVAALGFKARHVFEDDLLETIRWYQEHAPWWQKIKSGEFQKYYDRMYAKRENG